MKSSPIQHKHNSLKNDQSSILFSDTVSTLQALYRYDGKCINLELFGADVQLDKQLPWFTMLCDPNN